MGHEELGPNNKTKKYKIIILGLLVHVLLLFAVFDIYFSSPLDHGMNPIRSTTNPPAKRLVLFVADGLRAEAVLDENLKRIPYLKSIMETKGSWGVAHTRVPTESRPGHVALLAGIYEDPSAILKGWKANPVYFDSVINQSSNAWCWGSPDILNIFNKDNSSHINLETYSADLEDFGATDTGFLDLWVFNRVERFLLEKVNNCTSQCEKFKGGGNVFFLHLLGIDTAGHGYKPRSPEYIKNIQLVDEHVGKMVELFNAVFKDDQTAFVFTADHGMTDWGSHGAGSAHETEAPLIAWGPGIKTKPQRQDVKQIDIAPLLSSLIGINFPSNSLGIVPLQYLDMDREVLAQIQFSNALQLLELFNVKRLRTESNSLVYVPYQGLTSRALEDKISFLRGLEEDRKHQELIEECQSFVKVLTEGLEYYHNYYQVPLLLSISIGFVGWILFLVTSIFEGRRPWKSKAIPMMLNVIPMVMCFVQNFPLSYYVYFSFPFLVFTSLVDFQKLLGVSRLFLGYVAKKRPFSDLVYVVGLELLVYGFFNRTAFSVLSIIIGLWVLPSSSFGRYASRRDKVLWLSFCLILSIFPFFPVMKTTFNIPMYLLGCLTWVLLFYEMYCRLKFQQQFRNLNIRYGVFLIQFLCLIVASAFNVCLEKGLIVNNSSLKYLSWPLFILPISLIPLTSKSVAARLIATFFGFAPFYILVSSNFEALFSSILVAVLCNWLLIEVKSFNASDFSTGLIYYVNFDSYQSKEKISSDMFRRAFLFMVFIFLGFFGTGNIASLNSFDPMWVRAFLTVFSPFKMMGLILVKIIVPFLFTCCVFRAINSIGKENILQMFCIILIFSDLMVLQFLYLITNVGSWLDIGSSLSHFIIMEAFVTILLVLYGLAHLLTTASFRLIVL